MWHRDPGEKTHGKGPSGLFLPGFQWVLTNNASPGLRGWGRTADPGMPSAGESPTWGWDGHLGLSPRTRQHLLLCTQPVLAVGYPALFLMMEIGWLVVKPALAPGCLMRQRREGWIRGWLGAMLSLMKSFPFKELPEIVPSSCVLLFFSVNHC